MNNWISTLQQRRRASFRQPPPHPLAQAIVNQKFDQLETLSQSYGDLTKEYPNKVMCPLSHALLIEQPDVLQEFLKTKPDLNTYASATGDTFLHEAISGAGLPHSFRKTNFTMRARSVLLLLRYGADPDRKNKAGVSARDLLAQVGVTIEDKYLRIKE
jgi:hypothetical protein